MHRRGSDTSHIPCARGSVALAAVGLFLALWTGPVGAQTVPNEEAERNVPAWQLVVDGRERAWDEAPAWPLDSLRAATRKALAHVQRKGYYRARVDSVAVRHAPDRPRVHIYVRRGPRVRIGRLQLRGAEALSTEALRAEMQTRAGTRLDPSTLEQDIEAMLARYEAAGYPLAQIRVEEVDLLPEDASLLRLTIAIDEGPALWLKRVEVDGAARTTSRFAARAAQLDVGAPLADYDPEAVRRRLEDTGLFDRVGTPALEVGSDGGAVLRVPVEEGPPGAFDVVFGYLPSDARGRTARLVGSGRLRLEHPFGGGRTAGLQIDRRPGQVSRAEARLADPYVLGTPLRLAGGFAGEQRDSTYGKQRYRLAAGYLVGAETEVFGTLTRELTRPGRSGVRMQKGQQRIPRSASWFTGLGVRVHRTDRAVNPRRGFQVETTLERGQKMRRFHRIDAEGDTVRTQRNERQERLRFTGRLFVPTLAHQLVALGADAAVLRSDTYDRSDLFRIGGAATLRGYDEDRFLGHTVGRFLLEYRYQIDRRSYAYLFGDLGYVAAPALGGRPHAERFYPGYGLGLQFSTELGLVRASYALNPEDGSPANGRVHLGLSFGL